MQRQLNRRETSLEIGPVMCGDLLYDKGGSNQGGKDDSSVNKTVII